MLLQQNKIQTRSRVGKQNCCVINSDLKDQKQFISFERNSTKKATDTCDVPQGSILRPLLFLLYANDLNHAAKVLNPIMFADDTNPFISHSDISILFEKNE